MDERKRKREREKGCEWDRVRGRERGLIHKKPMKETVLGVEKVIVQASPFSVPKKKATPCDIHPAVHDHRGVTLFYAWRVREHQLWQGSLGVDPWEACPPISSLNAEDVDFAVLLGGPVRHSHPPRPLR